jgi:DNA-directed RNA polymerase subunit RPC12/RpoP
MGIEKRAGGVVHYRCIECSRWSTGGVRTIAHLYVCVMCTGISAVSSPPPALCAGQQPPIGPSESILLACSRVGVREQSFKPPAERHAQ